jgi:hypothetical protein
MELREVIFENLIGDLDYHPKRGGLYLCLGAAALCLWAFASPDARFSTVPLVLGAGSLTLMLKGVFLLRKTSKGLDTSQDGLSLSRVGPISLTEGASPSKHVRPWPASAAQIVQDFGAGALLLWPVLHFAQSVNEEWNLPTVPVLLGGLGIFLLGWGLGRIFRSTHART